MKQALKVNTEAAKQEIDFLKSMIKGNSQDDDKDEFTISYFKPRNAN